MPIKKSTKTFIDTAIDDYREEMVDAVTEIAVSAHVAGDVAAYSKLGIPIAENVVQEEALKFGKVYAARLSKTGGTIINGKQVNWLADSVLNTRKDVYNTIKLGLAEGKPVASIGGKLAAPGTVAHDLKNTLIRDKDYEYVRIARTETARIQNQATLSRFAKNGITHVNVVDGDYCEECAAANGQVWTIEYAQTHELEHPNCTRAFGPVITADWEPPAEEISPLAPKKPPAPSPASAPAQPPKVQVDVDESDLWGLPPDDFEVNVIPDKPKIKPKPEPSTVTVFKPVDEVMASKAIDAYTKKQMKIRPKGWSKTVADMADYIEEGYIDINEALRSNFAGLSAAKKAALESKIKRIDDFLKNAPKVKGKVYRGAAFHDDADFKNFIQAFEKSDSVTMKSFTSTSARRDVADAFAEGQGGNSVIFNIETSKGVYVRGFSTLDEAEVLLRPNAKFSVKSVNRKAAHYYEIDLVELADDLSDIKKVTVVKKPPVAKPPVVKKPLVVKKPQEVPDELAGGKLPSRRMKDVLAEADPDFDALSLTDKRPASWKLLEKKGWKGTTGEFNENTLAIYRDMVHLTPDGKIIAISSTEVKGNTIKILKLEMNSGMNTPAHMKRAMKDIVDDGVQRGATEVSISLADDSLKAIARKTGMEERLGGLEFSGEKDWLMDISGRVSPLPDVKKEKSKVAAFFKKADKGDAKRYDDAIKAYTKGSDQAINNAMREGGLNTKKMISVTDPEELIRLNKVSDDLSDYINVAPKFEGEVYRGIAFGEDKDAFMEFMSKTQGQSHMPTASFTSTSMNKDVAKGFAAGEYKVIMVIDSNRGAFLGGKSKWSKELEVLYDKGTNFKINDIVKITDSHYELRLTDAT